MPGAMRPACPKDLQHDQNLEPGIGEPGADRLRHHPAAHRARARSAAPVARPPAARRHAGAAFDLVGALGRPRTGPAAGRRPAGQPHIGLGPLAGGAGPCHPHQRGGGAAALAGCQRQQQPRLQRDAGHGGHHPPGGAAGRVGDRPVWRQPCRPRCRRGTVCRRPGRLARRPGGGGRRDRRPLQQPAHLRSAAESGPGRRRLAQRNCAADGSVGRRRLPAPRHSRPGPRQQRRCARPSGPAAGPVRHRRQSPGGTDRLAGAGPAPVAGLCPPGHGRTTGRPVHHPHPARPVAGAAP